MERIGMIEKYFASANGYGGFRSYFSSIFNEEELKRFYIIKGGPGTGKSTLMRRVAEEIGKDAESCELILCSSDPASLDGVILSTKNGKVAIVDGTAPHLTDTRFPGAVSEIISLGDGWDSSGLRARRKEITELTLKKNAEYTAAYELLAAAGKIRSKVISASSKHFDTKRAARAAKILLSEVTEYRGKISARLIGSFGKDGGYSLPISDKYKKIKICGSYSSAVLYMSVIKKTAEDYGYLKAPLPSALSEDIYDGILTCNTAFVISSDGISADTFLTDLTTFEVEELRALEAMHEELLELSKRRFFAASMYHFSLEEIYSSYMDYSKSEGLEARVKGDFRSALGL